MFRIIVASLLLAISSMGHVTAGGGPDVFGYTWLASSDTAGPVYNWIDITQRQGAVQINNLTDDNSSGPVPIGFDFPYYWTKESQVWIGSNGWLSFGQVSNIAHCFPSIPQQAGPAENYLAPFLSDLNYSSSFPGFPNPATCWYWSNQTDSFIVSWIDVPWWKNPQGGSAPPDWNGSNTFQIILDRKDSSITFQYKSLTPNDFVNLAQCNTELIIGIENLSGTIGLEAFRESFPDDSSAIRFIPPDSLVFQVQDLTPLWNNNTGNQGQFEFANVPFHLETNIKNVGNARVSSPTRVVGELLRLNFSPVWKDTVMLGSLDPDEDSLIQFPKTVFLTDPGQYYFNVSLFNGDDLNPGNNELGSEIALYNCRRASTEDSVSMSYATLNNPDGLVQWPGGQWNYGVANYIEAPASYYPLTINSVWAFILSFDGNLNTPMRSGFLIEIYAPDSTGGPGQLMSSDTVPVSQTLEDQWNLVQLDTPVVLNQGGFFVAWFQGGDSIGLGTEGIGPISRRSHEILNGVWNTYRENDVEEFLLVANTIGSCPDSRRKPKPDRNGSFSLFPNPAQDNIRIKLDAFRPGTRLQAELRDGGGRSLGAWSFIPDSEGFSESIPVGDFPNGIYYLILSNQDQFSGKPLVIQR